MRVVDIFDIRANDKGDIIGHTPLNGNEVKFDFNKNGWVWGDENALAGDLVEFDDGLKPPLEAPIEVPMAPPPVVAQDVNDQWVSLLDRLRHLKREHNSPLLDEIVAHLEDHARDWEDGYEIGREDGRNE